MASKIYVRKSKLLGRVALTTGPCAFCQREIDDELTYGKLYTIGDIHCHYFCVLLSCCLIQKGRDVEGLFGFMYPDILVEIERSKKHKCSYCNHEGATLGCAVSQCRKQFHLPCGREKNAVSMFYGNYKSYCQKHFPKQKIPHSIMEKVKQRNRKKLKTSGQSNDKHDEVEHVCVICYEGVDAFPSLKTFWPPCCARDAWFHRTCLQRMALSAGMHYLKCPLCNDKEQFYQAVINQGFYVPDRDAAWELEQNAFSEIYERSVSCSAGECWCPSGREYDVDNGPWDIKLCVLCGSVGAHAHCCAVDIYVCSVCQPAAPTDPEELAAINAVTLPEPNQGTRAHGPAMLSRMSLRRTKPRLRHNMPSCSGSTLQYIATNHLGKVHSENTLSSRSELNLKTPIRPTIKMNLPVMNVENKFWSPIKILEECLSERLRGVKELDSFVLDPSEVIGEMREEFKRPKPLVVKKRIVDKILDKVINSMLNGKANELIREWNSPKKCCNNYDNVVQLNTVPVTPIQKPEEKSFEITPNILTEEFLHRNLPIISPIKLRTVNMQSNSSMEISEHDEIVNVDVKTNEEKSPRNEKFSLKFSPTKEVLGKTNIDIDLETFKSRYLNEIGRDLNSSECVKLSKKQKKNKKIVRSRVANVEDKQNTETRKDSFTALRKNRSRKRAKSAKDLVLQFPPEKKKRATEVSIRDKSIHVNIKWKKERFKLKITKSGGNANMKQCVLQYSPERSKKIMMKPSDVSPPKRKYVKKEKITDNLVQTSIQSFFKVKTEN